jgi:hypothetical protein
MTREFAREATAYRCALAYVAACASAVLDYVERTTGRCDYNDYSDVVSVEKVQELSRAKSTAEYARKIAADADLMRQLAYNCPQLGVLAKDYVGDLLGDKSSIPNLSLTQGEQR